MASTGTKRGSELDSVGNKSPRNKKPKAGSIRDYMTVKPQQPKASRLHEDIVRDGRSNVLDNDSTSHKSSSKVKSTERDLRLGEKHVSASEFGSRSKFFKDDSTQREDTIGKQDQDEDQSTATSNTLLLPESTGDIFDAPEGTLIIHACNCKGSWGAGIAAAFRKHYPGAYKLYAARCEKWGSQLFESAQLIPPQKLDHKGHFVGCLYTSRLYGKKKDSPSKILSVTAPAMRDLLEKVQEWNDEHEHEERVQEVRMCMINSGLFAVPWEKTRAALEGIDVSKFDVKEVKVISREE